MGGQFLGPYVGRYWTVWWRLLVVLSLLLLTHCDSGGQSGSLSPPPARNATLEQQAIETLIELYQAAFIQEDVDRLQELLDMTTLASFLEAVGDAFRVLTVTDLQVSQVDTQVAPDPLLVSLQQALTIQDPVALEQQTLTGHRTWHLHAVTDPNGVVRVLIQTISSDGPEFRITTRGQVQADVPAQVEVEEETGTFAIASVRVLVPETSTVQALRAAAPPAQGGLASPAAVSMAARQEFVQVGRRFVGSFTPPTTSDPEPLQVLVRGTNGEEMILRHSYRLRMPGEGVVERIAAASTEGGSAPRFFSVAVAPDGTVWAGADGGRIFRVLPGGATAEFVGRFTTDPDEQIEDIVIDGLERVHIIRRSSGSALFEPVNQIVVRHQDVFCATVNAFDPAYPFRVRQSGTLVPSPSTRATAADGGDIWLFGSDGGTALVSDGFRDGFCPPAGEVDVRYEPILRRDDSDLLSNSVQAVVAATDGAVWFGTAYGLTRFQDGQFTAVPFDPELSLQGDPSTLEEFFQEVAQAIFAARPLTAVRIGNESFVDSFGSPLVKADLIFSGAEDSQGRIWVGTLGDGLRRIEIVGGTPTDTLHLTREEGLGSNLIASLALSSDESIWAATQEGASRIRASGATVSITNFSFLDGLAFGVRDVAVDAMGTAWLATDEGLFRIRLTAGGVLQGLVRDSMGNPVVGAAIHIRDTPFQTVTDETGRYRLVNLPSGAQHLQVDGRLAVDGPFVTAFQEITITDGEQTLPETAVVQQGPTVAVDPLAGGQLTFPNLPGAVLDIPPGAVQFPSGALPAISLTPLSEPSAPLCEGFLAVAIVDLQPTGTTFVPAAQLTLPNAAQLDAGRLLTLLRLDAENFTCEVVGFGQVSEDGSVLTTTSGLTGFSAVIFATAATTDNTQLVDLQGDGLMASVGQSVSLVTAVRTEDGQDIAGVPVTYTVLEGDSTVTDTTVRTGADGVATTALIVGATAGINRVEARVTGLEPVIFTVIGLADSATARLLEVSGNHQAGLPGVELAEGLLVALRDQAGNPLPGQEMRAAVIEGHAQFLSSAVATTDGQGQAAFRLRVGNDAQGNIIIAFSALEADPLLFTVRTPSRLVAVNETPSAPVGSTVRLQAAARDVNGQGMSGVPVTFTILSGSGTLSASTTTTGADGVATTDLTLSTVAGITQVEARAAVLDPVRFTVTGDADLSSARLIEVSGNNQAAIPGELLPDSLIVRLQDEFGNPIAGQNVPCLVRRGAASCLPIAVPPIVVTAALRETALTRQALPSAVTDDRGEAAFSVQVAPEAAGNIFVEMTALTADPVQFRATVESLIGPTGYDVAVDDGTLMLLDARRNAVVRIDPTSGAFTLVSGCIDVLCLDVEGNGPLFVSVQGIAIEASATLIVADAGQQAVFRVDPLSGERTIVSGCVDAFCLDVQGNGPPFGFFGLRGITIGADGSIFVADNVQAAVFRVDPLSGERTIVSGCVDAFCLDVQGNGPPFDPFTFIPQSITFDQGDGSLVVAVTSFFGTPPALVRVDPMSGDRTVVSGCAAVDPFFGTCVGVVGAGPALSDPRRLAIETDGAFIVADGRSTAVFRVDPISGDRSIASGSSDAPTLCVLSDSIVGTGPCFDFPDAIAAQVNGALWVVDAFLDSGKAALLRIERASGNRLISAFLQP